MIAKIEYGRVHVVESGNWEYAHRVAQPHEIVPALIEIIEDLQDRLAKLEAWYSRIVS